MRLFLYEHLTGGGMLAAGQALSPSLLREGLAMVSAVAEDLASIEGVELRLLKDYRLPFPDSAAVSLPVLDECAWRDAFALALNWSQGVLLIAPETDAILEGLATQVERSGKKLFSPASRFVALAADKQLTAQVLRASKIPAPFGALWTAGEPPPQGVHFPAVIKPVDGCGSQGVRKIDSSSQLPTEPGRFRLESFCAGLPASVAVLAGPPSVLTPLPACRQRLSGAGDFTYLGGETPLCPQHNERAQRIALAAVNAIAAAAGAAPVGYVGVDLVLGDDPYGACDAVIEVNPRLTTSYVGLRRACRRNLGEAMLRIAQGDAVSVDFHGERIEFDATGKIYPPVVSLKHLA